MEEWKKEDMIKRYRYGGWLRLTKEAKRKTMTLLNSYKKNFEEYENLSDFEFQRAFGTGTKKTMKGEELLHDLSMLMPEALAYIYPTIAFIHRLNVTNIERYFIGKNPEEKEALLYTENEWYKKTHKEMMIYNGGHVKDDFEAAPWTCRRKYGMSSTEMLQNTEKFLKIIYKVKDAQKMMISSREKVVYTFFSDFIRCDQSAPVYCADKGLKITDFKGFEKQLDVLCLDEHNTVAHDIKKRVSLQHKTTHSDQIRRVREDLMVSLPYVKKALAGDKEFKVLDFFTICSYDPKEIKEILRRNNLQNIFEEINIYLEQKKSLLKAVTLESVVERKQYINGVAVPEEHICTLLEETGIPLLEGTYNEAAKRMVYVEDILPYLSQRTPKKNIR